jgi:hypothetical protein
MAKIYWEVIYDDNSVHTQDELVSHSKVDLDKLKEFRLYKDGVLLISVFFDKKKKLIFRIRHIVRGLCINSENEERVYLVGWKPKKGEPTIFYIYEDGHIEADGARNNLQLLPFEEWDKQL